MINTAILSVRSLCALPITAAVALTSHASPLDCSQAMSYSAGTSYTLDQRVSNSNTVGERRRYRCVIPGWCSLNAAWAYEPGKGTAWDSAWDDEGLCQGGGGGPDTNTPPIATINGPYSALVAQSITFSSAGSADPDGDSITFLWDFGDGNQSNAANPSHRYTDSGNYPVTLTVTDIKNASTLASTTAVIREDGGASAIPNPIPVAGGYAMTRANIDAVESSLTSSPLFEEVKHSIAVRENSIVEAVLPGNVTNPDNVQRVEDILSPNDWAFIFSLRDASYTYTRFLRAVAKFPAFCQRYTDGRDSEAICRKSLAVMFAHFTQETGAHNPSSSIDEWRQGLFYLSEVGCSEHGPGCGYNASCHPGQWQAEAWPCGRNADNSFKKYFGRGAKQLSYNYNYGPFSQAMFGDVRVLLDAPERVANTWLNLASAVFFFTYPQPPKPSMLHVIDGTWQPNSHDLMLGLTPGFGVTTHIINGGIECGKGSETAQSQNRIAYYRDHAQTLGVPVRSDEQLACANMRSFDNYGAAAMQIYWEQDWAYYPDRPEGKSFACKLVNYQTRFNALLTGDYENCVVSYFGIQVLP